MNYNNGTPNALKKNRDIRIDAIKGLGIILMVAVHGGCPGSHFINLFHMPIFFIASGYLFGDKQITDFSSLWKYIRRKLQTLWLPYVITNGLLVLLNNFFIKIGIYTTNPALLDLVEGQNNAVQHYLSLQETLITLLKVLVFSNRPQLGAPTWFLRTLFFVTVMHAVVKFIGSKIKFRHADICLLVLSCIGATVVVLMKLTLPLGLHTVFAAYIVYYIGITLRKLNFTKFADKHPIPLFFGSLALLIALSFFGSVAMASAQITNIVYFALVSLCGWLAAWSLVTYCPKLLVKPISFVGEHSLYVVLLHLCAFKAVSYLYLTAAGGDMLLLAAFPHIENVPFLWIAYLAAGLSVPLALDCLYRLAKAKVLKKINLSKKKSKGDQCAK